MKLSRIHRGFTLVELLVAIAVFAIMSTVAYNGLQSVLDTNEATKLEAEKLKKLQTAIWFLERDLHHAVNRGSRDEFGDIKSSMLGAGTSQASVTFTYTGNPNPLKQKRSSLKRVSYQLEDEKLVRITYPVLDRVQDTRKYQATLLENIEELRFRFMNEKKQWQDSWPPLQSDGTTKDQLPVAVEIILNDKKWGKINRIVTLPGY